MGALPMDLGILLTQPRHSASGIFPLPSTLCPGNLWWYKGVCLAGKLKRSKKKKGAEIPTSKSGSLRSECNLYAKTGIIILTYMGCYEDFKITPVQNAWPVG